MTTEQMDWVDDLNAGRLCPVHRERYLPDPFNSRREACGLGCWRLRGQPGTGTEYSPSREMAAQATGMGPAVALGIEQVRNMHSTDPDRWAGMRVGHGPVTPGSRNVPNLDPEPGSLAAAAQDLREACGGVGAALTAAFVLPVLHVLTRAVQALTRALRARRTR